MNKQNEKIGLLISGGNLIFYFRILIWTDWLVESTTTIFVLFI